MMDTEHVDTEHVVIACRRDGYWRRQSVTSAGAGMGAAERLVKGALAAMTQGMALD
jgi:hypothetical protein